MAGFTFKGISGILSSSLQHMLRTTSLRQRPNSYSLENNGRGWWANLVQNRTITKGTATQKVTENGKLIGSFQIGKSKKKSKSKGKYLNPNNATRKQSNIVVTYSKVGNKKTPFAMKKSVERDKTRNVTENSFLSALRKKERLMKELSNVSKKNNAPNKKQLFDMRNSAVMTSAGKSLPDSGIPQRPKDDRDELDVIRNYTAVKKDYFPSNNGEQNNRNSDFDRLDLDLVGDCWVSNNFDKTPQNDSHKTKVDVSKNLKKNAIKREIGIDEAGDSISSNAFSIESYEDLLYNEKRYQTKYDSNKMATKDQKSSEENRRPKDFILVDESFEYSLQPTKSPYGMGMRSSNIDSMDIDDLIKTLQNKRLERQSPHVESLDKIIATANGSKNGNRVLMTPRDQMETYIFDNKCANVLSQEVSNVPNNTAKLPSQTNISELRPDLKRNVTSQSHIIKNVAKALNGEQEGTSPEPILSVQPSEIINRKKQNYQRQANLSVSNLPRLEKPWFTELLSDVCQSQGSSEMNSKNQYNQETGVSPSSSKSLKAKKGKKSKGSKLKKESKFVFKNESKGWAGTFPGKNSKSYGSGSDGLKVNDSSKNIEKNTRSNRIESDLVRDLRKQWKDEFKKKFVRMQRNALPQGSLNTKPSALALNAQGYSKQLSETRNFPGVALPKMKTKNTLNTPISEKWRTTPTMKQQSNSDGSTIRNVAFDKEYDAKTRYKNETSLDPYEEWINLQDDKFFQLDPHKDDCSPKLNVKSNPFQQYSSKHLMPPASVTKDSQPFLFHPDMLTNIDSDIKSSVSSSKQHSVGSVSTPKPLSPWVDELDGLMTMNLQPVIDCPLKKVRKGKQKLGPTKRNASLETINDSNTSESQSSPKQHLASNTNSISQQSQSTVRDNQTFEELQLQRYLLTLQNHHNTSAAKQRKDGKKSKKEKRMK